MIKETKHTAQKSYEKIPSIDDMDNRKKYAVFLNNLMQNAPSESSTPSESPIWYASYLSTKPVINIRFEKSHEYGLSDKVKVIWLEAKIDSANLYIEFCSFKNSDDSSKKIYKKLISNGYILSQNSKYNKSKPDTNTISKNLARTQEIMNELKSLEDLIVQYAPNKYSELKNKAKKQ